MKKNKAYKYRIYPTAEQATLFEKTFGCCRFIWNQMLADRIQHYKDTGESLSCNPAQYKKEYEWLKEVDALALTSVWMHLNTAYKNFFGKSGFPKFKSKHRAKSSYTTNCLNNNIRIADGMLRLPKVGLVKVKFHRPLPIDCRIKSVTVSRESSGQYHASILIEYEVVDSPINLDPNKSIGLDYSSPHFYVDSEGNIADMPHFYREALVKLALEQRKLSRKKRGSRNYEKQRLKVAKLHQKIRNQRADWQHKLSKELAERYDYIFVEDINYKGLSQALSLGKATMDNAFGQFLRFLSYKLEDRGKALGKVDKWFPSSKTCNHCKSINVNLKLSDRTWVCSNCGTLIDRDYNAALNIKEEGLRLYA